MPKHSTYHTKLCSMKTMLLLLLLLLLLTAQISDKKNTWYGIKWRVTRNHSYTWQIFPNSAGQSAEFSGSPWQIFLIPQRHYLLCELRAFNYLKYANVMSLCMSSVQQLFIIRYLASGKLELSSWNTSLAVWLNSHSSTHTGTAILLGFIFSTKLNKLQEFVQLSALSTNFSNLLIFQQLLFPSTEWFLSTTRCHHSSGQKRLTKCQQFSK